MLNDYYYYRLVEEVVSVFDFYENGSKYMKLADRYDGDYDMWEEDGKRFLNKDFIQMYAETKTPPTLNDGKTEFIEWIRMGLCSSFFWMQFVHYQRTVLGKNFLTLMLNAYEPYEQDLKFAVKSIKLLIEMASNGIDQ